MRQDKTKKWKSKYKKRVIIIIETNGKQHAVWRTSVKEQAS